MKNYNDKLIELKQVSKKYKNKLTLNNINLIINKKDRIGVIGPNGAGKSTLSEIIGGIRKPTSGKIIKDNNLKIGLQFQDSKYPVGITVFDILKYYLEIYSIKITKNQLDILINQYQILDLKNKELYKLSGGQQQRVNILLSLILNPDLVIFDEISTGLDIQIKKEIFNFIKENVILKNKSMFLVTHNMSEIEEMCNKYIYIQDGQIIEQGNVEDIVKKYGSVHNYTWKKFKSQNINKKNIEKSQIKNKFDKIINNNKNIGKNLPLLKLILKYYYKGMAVPFFLLAFPLILLFIEGFAFKEIYNGISDELVIHTLRQLIISIGSVGIVIVGISVLPQTIIEYKHSVMLKRIGATNTKISSFIISIIIMCFIFMIFTFFWTLLWGGIFFGSKYGWNEIVGFKNVKTLFLFLLLTILTSISFGLALSCIFKKMSPTAFITISNIIYIPIAFFSGSFMPIDLIKQSNILNKVSYINLFKYCIYPFIDSWMDIFTWNLESYIFLVISIILILFFLILTITKLNWEK